MAGQARATKIHLDLDHLGSTGNLSCTLRGPPRVSLSWLAPDQFFTVSEHKALQEKDFEAYTASDLQLSLADQSAEQ